ncbi:MAG: hypothetical protein M1826_001446 [Phylliscum demangeonii]|nr:MAG: hypothetical protein M1826_001446 [Phylliscum demangeonii]
MDAALQRELSDKLYDKRKVGALNLEKLVKDALANNEHEKIKKIVDQLCHDYAYAVHHPHARNGGLIGLAAASIALGPEVARYLQDIVPPVLACFSDHEARVRYYACESMYNISKVAKGEVLIFFNEIFDALCKLAADAELSVKNGAELLDRLIKDIVSESAANYVSVLQNPEEAVVDADPEDPDSFDDYPTAFSLARFVPLLTERIHVLNPFTRIFLVSWITLLDSIPDLELVFYLPAFLGGLFKFLNDPHKDVQIATQGALERFLAEIKQIAQIKKGIEERKKTHSEEGPRGSVSSQSVLTDAEAKKPEDIQESSGEQEGFEDVDEGDDDSTESDWMPGQDVYVDHPKILEILVGFLDPNSEEDIQLTALRWIESFFEICPGDILPFIPQMLSRVLPAMANDVAEVRLAANRLNTSLLEYIVSLPGEARENDQAATAVMTDSGAAAKDGADLDRRELGTTSKSVQSHTRDADSKKSAELESSTLAEESSAVSVAKLELDYAAAINALTLHFLNEHETARAAALTWLIMLHRKAPRKVLSNKNETFPALLKTLSDPSEAVVIRDLQLLSQISKNSDDDYFASFMVNLLQLFSTDRRLLELRGNLIIRQLCVSLSAERIYRALADCLEKDEDVEFASIMVQNLNNNLITAPELADLRKRLKNLETKDGQAFFMTLFRSWCHNAVATFSLCLLAQAYEQAYHLLQIFAELEMTIQMLIQIDKLVQLLESPVFTYLRLQLLEPERYPHLYKCLYGLLMLLPQSSAFAALKNRLNSVSAIGYLHIAPRTPLPTPSAGYERPNRLKGRDDGTMRWAELLEKFKTVQEKARRQQRLQRYQHGLSAGDHHHHHHHHTDGVSLALGLGGLSAHEEEELEQAISSDRPSQPQSQQHPHRAGGGGGGGGGAGNERAATAAAAAVAGRHQTATPPGPAGPTGSTTSTTSTAATKAAFSSSATTLVPTSQSQSQSHSPHPSQRLSARSAGGGGGSGSGSGTGGAGGAGGAGAGAGLRHLSPLSGAVSGRKGKR